MRVACPRVFHWARADVLGPDLVRTWLRLVFRDLVAPALGVLLLLHEAFASGVRPWIILAGMTLLGYPIADRIDGWIRKNGNGKNGNGNGKGGSR